MLHYNTRLKCLLLQDFIYEAFLYGGGRAPWGMGTLYVYVQLHTRAF